MSPDLKFRRLYLIAFILFLVDIIQFVLQFPFLYADSDQAIMWQAAYDFSNGYFPVPLYYGQAYNTHLESLLAVPFIKAGMSIPTSVQIATLLFLFVPIFLFLRRWYRAKDYVQGILLMAIFISLPVQYYMLCSLPRGFITGISLFTMGIYFFEKMPTNPLRQLLFVMLSSLAFFANLNFIFLAAPISIPFVIKNIKQWRNYLVLIFSCIIPVVAQILISRYYLENSSLVIHHYQYHWNFSELQKNHSALKYLFNFTVPFIKYAGLTFIAFLVIVGVLSIKRKNYQVAYITVTAFGILLLMVFLNKTYDGTTSPFFSYSRLFLATPILIALILSLLFAKRISVKMLSIITFMSAISIPFDIKELINLNETFTGYTNVVQIEKKDKLELEYKRVAQLLKEHQTTHLLLGEKNDFLNYGLCTIAPEIKTLDYHYERRNWVIKPFYNHHGKIAILCDSNCITEIKYAKLAHKVDTAIKFGTQKLVFATH